MIAGNISILESMREVGVIRMVSVGLYRIISFSFRQLGGLTAIAVFLILDKFSKK